jgi:hypothetical protein
VNNRTIAIDLSLHPGGDKGLTLYAWIGNEGDDPSMEIHLSSLIEGITMGAQAISIHVEAKKDLTDALQSTIVSCNKQLELLNKAEVFGE